MKGLSLLAFSLGVMILFFLPYVVMNFQTQGEKEWSQYTGQFKWIDVETDTCCHFHTRIKLSGHDIIHTVDGNEELENMFVVNKTYTFYLEPFREPAAATPGYFWDQVINYVEDEKGNVVYGFKWL